MPEIRPIQKWQLPRNLRGSVEPYINRWEWLVPSWCHIYRIAFNPEIEGNVIARIRPRPDSRAAELEIGPRWIDVDDRERDDAIVHEFIHLQIGWLQRYYENLESSVKNILGKEAMKLLADTWEDALEGTTQDLTNAIHGRLNRLGRKR